jgi:hypothetical protein
MLEYPQGKPTTPLTEITLMLNSNFLGGLYKIQVGGNDFRDPALSIEPLRHADISNRYSSFLSISSAVFSCIYVSWLEVPGYLCAIIRGPFPD